MTFRTTSRKDGFRATTVQVSHTLTGVDLAVILARAESAGFGVR